MFIVLLTNLMIVKKELVEMLVKSMDSDRDGDIEFEEFHAAVLRNPLFLECMGPVLPSREARYAFLTTLTDRLPSF